MHGSSRTSHEPLALAAFALALSCFAFTSAPRANADETFTIGSKNFTESVVLGELGRFAGERAGVDVAHRRELGGSRILFEALRQGEIDVYPEYTGTLIHELLAGHTTAIDSLDALGRALAPMGLAVMPPLGFENTYAIGLRKEQAQELSLRRISDLRPHTSLRYGFSNEFMDREDGWPGLAARYGLRPDWVRGMDHDLAYRALESGEIDAVDLYSTDADIAYYDLATLEDDLRYFPEYKALYLYRDDLAERSPTFVAALRALSGTISEGEMVAMNARVKLERMSEAAAAGIFLGVATDEAADSFVDRLRRTTAEHLALVGASLLAAIAVAIPLGIASAKRPRLGAFVLGTTGVLQTLPSLALFVFMIPLFGIGWAPAVVALFLYSLLPVVRNTHAGLTGIDPALRDSALALGLPARQRLLWIELPLASHSILAGIKTAAVINVGTATLAALIGAGGYGQPILTGIRLDDTALILEGAVPAAVLALAAQGVFAALERWLGFEVTSNS
ncbi:MAG: glycine betaine ABC transporter substrate-binding protein [Myxococcota bacterium]|jgi:osmoprotectant transport system permease protein|nr:glycine betaine ABC transporter substrate-binding protein [Myxococcota bacterium]